MKRKLWKWMLCIILMGSIFIQGSRMPAFSAETTGEDYPGNNSEQEMLTDISAEDLSDNFDFSRREIKAAVTDVVYENYIRENVNPDYTSVDEMKIVNAVLVKQSLFDRAYVKPQDTLDSIMGGIEEGNDACEYKFITQISNCVALYELSEESEYYVAYVNTMLADKDVSLQEYVFALYDDSGSVLEDCIYEKETGLAYIPRKDCINDKGEQIVMNVQIQMMQLMDFADTCSEVLTSVTEKNSLVSVSSTSSQIFEVETKVQAEAGLEESNMTVSVNGIPIQEDYYSYEADTGVLTLNQSSAMIQTVSVMTEKNSLAEQVADLLFPANEVYAMNADQMTAVATGIELPTWVSNGTLMTGSANYSYNGSSEWTYSYGFGINDEELLAQMVSLIEYGGSLDMSKIKTQNGSGYITTFVKLSTNTLQNAGRTIESLRNIPELHMECCHVDTPLGSVSGSEVNGGKWSLQPIRLRFLNVDRINNYAIIGIYTIETHRQTGCAFFKIGISPQYGLGHIGKKDAQNGTVLEGAVYQVYTDQACTVKAKDLDGHTAVFTTISEYPFSNEIKMKPGTYYVKESFSPEGYTLDTVVKKLVIKAGQRTWANNAGTDTGWNYDNRQIHLSLKKVPAEENLTKDNPCYSLAGAIYGVYGSVSDAREDKNRKAVLTTTEEGISNEVRLDAGTYYVKELIASPGYTKCDGSEDLAEEGGIHVINADSYGETYSVICREKPVSHLFPLVIKKGDLDTKDFLPQGTASLENAVFQIAFYVNTEGKTDKTPTRIWYFKTNKNGQLLCSEKESLTAFTTEEGKVLNSDPLFSDQDGNMVFPLGTYLIKEVQAPKYYQVSGMMFFEQLSKQQSLPEEGTKAVICEKNEEACIFTGDDITNGKLSDDPILLKVYDRIYRGKIKVIKLDENDRPLSGVSFQLKGSESGETYTGVTDEKGIAQWDNLIPQQYELTEIATEEGKTLLKEPVLVNLPMQADAEECQLEGMDTSRAVWDPSADAWCFYELTYEVKNQGSFVMPSAGGGGEKLWIPILIAGGVMLAAGGLLRKQNKKKGRKLFD